MPFRAGVCRDCLPEWHFLSEIFSSILILNYFYMKHLFLGLFGLLLTLPVSAQDFMDRLERVENGKGRVVVHQDPAIERLVNGSPEKKAGQQTDIISPKQHLVPHFLTYRKGWYGGPSLYHCIHRLPA